MKLRTLPLFGALLSIAFMGTLSAQVGAETAGARGAGTGDADTSRAQIGAVDRVEQRAEASFAERVRRLRQESPVYFLDLLRTGADARLSARLEDGSMVTMGENAELAIDEFVYTERKTREITLRAVKGALLFIGEKLFGGDSEVQIRTPVAILGVRGTEVWVGPIDGATGVLVIDGEVSVGSAKGVVVLGPGEGTMISDDGTLSPRKTWGEGKVARALEMVTLSD
jgi:ferric-dicitrate binding protein FerR (iron transport regulator)